MSCELKKKSGKIIGGGFFTVPINWYLPVITGTSGGWGYMKHKTGIWMEMGKVLLKDLDKPLVLDATLIKFSDIWISTNGS